MTNLKHIIYISTLGLLLTSCANYGVISDNDVYLQKPAAIDLADDEQDITSFNAYNAGRQGAFQNGDQRLIKTNARIFIASSNPFAFNNSMFSPYYGYNDPFGWNRPHIYSAYGPGWGYGWGYGNYGYGHGFNHMYGNSSFFYNGYQYGTFISPYYSHNHYGINYIGPDYNFYGSNASSGMGGTYGSSNIFQGQRRDLSGSSNRSSSYPQTLKSNAPNNVKPSNTSGYSKSKRLSSSNIKNRREVDNSQREYVRSNANVNRARSSQSREYYNGSSRNVNATSVNNRRTTSSASNARNRSFTPSNSARRTGTVSRSNSNYRSSGSYNSSGSSRGTYNSSSNSRRGSSRNSYSSPQRSSGSGYSRSSGSSQSRSSGSSTRSRGSSSSSSGRR